MNHIILIENGTEKEVSQILGCKVEWLGENSTLKVYMPYEIHDSTIQLGNNSLVEIYQNSLIRNLFCRCAADNSKIIFGKRFIMEGGQIILARGQKNQSVVIGDNCLFASQLFIATSDGHAIFDKNGSVINNVGGHIEIGNHCWLGHGVSILKNGGIASDTIVAESAVVSKKFNRSNCVLAGVPAKIIKTDINWDIKSPEMCQREYMQKIKGQKND